MNVGELIEALRRFPADLPVKTTWDSGWHDIYQIRIEPADPQWHPAMLLLDDDDYHYEGPTEVVAP